MYSSFAQNSLFLAALTAAGGDPDAELVRNVSETGQDIRIGQSPISLTGLESETYDYYGFLRINNTTGSGDLIPRFNSGVGTFADIQMRAQSTTASGNTNAASSAPALTSIDGTSILFEFRITGTIAGSRIISYQSGYALSTTDGMHDGKEVWSDTVNEITSFDLYSTVTTTFDYDYIVYRVLKGANNQGNYEYLQTLTWNNESTAKSFTGLSLDADKEYLITHEHISGASTYAMRFDGDTSSSYDTGTIQVIGSAITGAAATNTFLIYQTFSDTIFKGSSGSERSMLLSNLVATGGTDILQEASGLYTDTVSDITAINMNIFNSLCTATANLYKAKAGLTGDSMPFEFVEERTLSSQDMSTGGSPEIFTSLAGNSIDIFKIDYELVSTGNIDLQFRDMNGTSVSDLNINTLENNVATVSALAPATTTNVTVAKMSTDPIIGSIYLYPKSGAERPFLIKTGYRGATGVTISHGYWTDTVNELTGFTLNASAVNPVTGTIRLSKLIAI